MSELAKNPARNLPKRLHVVGICGVATSALAIALHKRGVIVTGSDKGFFPPVSTELERQGIKYYAGWHPEQMIADGVPDAVMIGGASGTQNPETAYAREHGIAMYSYPELMGAFFVKKNSIVCCGTWGKTSSSTLLSFIMQNAGMDPTYMFGGISLSHESSAALTDSDWNVFEGDEYKSSPTDDKAKFFYYKPTHLMLSAVSWDHADLYATEESYFDAFKKLLAGIPANGLVVACADNAGVQKIIGGFKGKVITYGTDSSNEFSYGGIVQTKNGIDFIISNQGKEFKIHSPMLGAYQAENMTACFAMATSVGVPADKIIDAISKFKGLKRRLEKRLDENSGPSGVTVFDDIAHSPEKAKSVLQNLRQIYSGKIIAVFEPNIGGRERASAAKYDNCFNDADIVVIPRMTKLKVASDGSEKPMEGDELAQVIAKTQPNTKYIDDDKVLVEFLTSNAKKGDVIAFLGSHGFRGMIEETVTSLRPQSPS